MKGVDKSAFNVVPYIIMKRCMHYNTLRPHHNFGKKMAMPLALGLANPRIPYHRLMRLT
jgi:hypothetical protein